MARPVAPDFDLTGRRILVTGAASGIGAATARLCAGLGASVDLVDVHPPDAIVTDIAASGGEARGTSIDVSDRGAVEALATDLGPVDGLVLAAGIQPYDDWQDEAWDDNWDRVLDVNARGAVNVARAFFDGLRGRDDGRIVLVGSQAGRHGGAYSSPHYVFSKGGLHAFTRWLARKGAADGVLVNAVAPGPVRTPFVEGLDIDAEAMPLGRVAAEEEIAGPIAFLLSPAARYVTGVILDVNGGLSFN